jgi:dUTP pyrophosphatase
MIIKIKKLDSDAIIPKYARHGDAGLDIVAISKNNTEDYIEYKTGLAFEIPEGFMCLVFPRSSISKTNLSLANSVGVLDSGYRGELILRYRKNGDKEYEVGDRIGQIIILPYPKIEFEEKEELSDTHRGK